MANGISQRLAGITSITVNGIAFNVTEASWSPNSLSTEMLIALNGVAGTRQMPVTSKIVATLYDTSAQLVAMFQGLNNITVQMIVPNGKSIIGTGMAVTGVQTVNAGEGTFEVTFEGQDVFEQIT
jgi:Phage tail tube protein